MGDDMKVLEFDIALEYNKEGKYWYAWVPKEPTIDVVKEPDIGDCLRGLGWLIEAHLEEKK